MKNNILKVFVLACLLVNVSAFAIGPDGTNGTQGQVIENPDDLNAATTPINSSLYLLAGAGILVGAFFFNRNKVVKA